MIAFLVPMSLFFGFVVTFVKQGDDFSSLLTLVTLVMASPTVVAVARAKKRRAVPMLVIVVLGFCAWAVLTRYGVRLTLTPAVIGVPMGFVAMWSALAVGVLAVGVRVASRYQRGPVWTMLAVTVCMLFVGLVVSPALFALGLTSYRMSGIYFGIPLVQQLFWIVSGVLLGALGAWQFVGDEDALPALSVDGTMVTLAFCTGIATGFHLWLPAILGLLLVQYTFHLRSSL